MEFITCFKIKFLTFFNFLYKVKKREKKPSNKTRLYFFYFFTNFFQVTCQKSLNTRDGRPVTKAQSMKKPVKKCNRLI